MQEYPIGTPGKPWGDEEKAQWLAQQSVKRSYHHEVLDKLNRVPEGFKLTQYGALPYDASRFPLKAVIPENFDSSLPNVLVTGGVHGYETSGVQGAIAFIKEHLKEYASKFNIVVCPCVSPWGYETINRWDPLALDPNRSFYKHSPAPEAAQLLAFIDSLELDFTMHIDLHETTDTDNSEFRPALAARDGTFHDEWAIPDGFYLVTNSKNTQLGFQKAIIENVRKVTHIAPADENGKLIGAEVLSEGVIGYDKKSLFLCGGLTDADYVSTTEVYPDSPNATPEICNKAQVAAVRGGLDYVLAQK